MKRVVQACVTEFLLATSQLLCCNSQIVGDVAQQVPGASTRELFVDGASTSDRRRSTRRLPFAKKDAYSRSLLRAATQRDAPTVRRSGQLRILSTRDVNAYSARRLLFFSRRVVLPPDVEQLCALSLPPFGCPCR